MQSFQQRDLSTDSILFLGLAELAESSWVLRPLREESVLELMRSIQNSGLLQPIVVRRAGKSYEVVFGSHRLEACKRLGMKRVHVLLKDMNEEEAFLARVSENLIRNSYVDPLEEAKGYKMLVARGWTINAIGQKVGKSDSYVCDRLSLLDHLSQKLLVKLASGELTPSHAEVLSRIRDQSKQEEVADWVKRRRLSVRSLEAILRHAPPPTRVKLQDIRNECYVKIPSGFLQATGLESGQTVMIYARGNKLILDNLDESPNEVQP